MHTATETTTYRPVLIHLFTFLEAFLDNMVGNNRSIHLIFAKDKANMDFRFIGTGGAFDYLQGNSSAIVDLNGQRILLDCGFTVLPRLMQLQVFQTIDTVLLTHLHDDHAGSLSALVFLNYYGFGRRTRLLVPDAEFQAEVSGFLAFTLKPEVQQYVEFLPLSAVPGIQALPTHHLHIPGMLSYGYVFSDDHRTIVYSGDLGNAAHLFATVEKLGRKPDTVLCDLTFLPNIAPHMHYTDILQYGSAYNLVGYHHNHALSPPDNPIPSAALLPEWLWS